MSKFGVVTTVYVDTVSCYGIGTGSEIIIFDSPKALKFFLSSCFYYFVKGKNHFIK